MDEFSETLNQLIAEVPGSLLAAVLGTDGVGVEVILSDTWPGGERDLVEVELAALASRLEEAGQNLETELGTEFFLGTTQVNLIGTVLEPGYILVLGVSPQGDLEQAWTGLAGALQRLGEPS